MASCGPTDFAGVYVNGGLVNGHLTNQKQELLDAIRGAEPATDNERDAHAGAARVPADRAATWTPRRSRAATAARWRMSASARAAATKRRLCAAEGGREFVEDKLQRKARLFVDQSRHAAGATLRSIGLRGPQPLRPRGTQDHGADVGRVPWWTSAEQPAALAGEASRAGVTIYCLDARGRRARGGVVRRPRIRTVPGGGLSGVGDTSDEGLDVLSAQTGGLTMRRTATISVARWPTSATTRARITCWATRRRIPPSTASTGALR